MNWVYLVAIPVAIAGWIGMSYITRNASRKNSSWEAPVPREGGRRWFRWPWSR